MAHFILIDPQPKYLVVTNNYMHNGGIEYKMFRSGFNAYNYGPDLERVLANYMAEQGAYIPKFYGRI